jgi:hypothetical protein
VPPKVHCVVVTLMLAHKRLQRELIALQKEPAKFIRAKPLDTDILVFHYVIEGPPDSPYGSRLRDSCLSIMRRADFYVYAASFCSWRILPRCSEVPCGVPCEMRERPEVDSPRQQDGAPPPNLPCTLQLKPPAIMMYTPSGRFEPAKRLCLSMSGM